MQSGVYEAFAEKLTRRVRELPVGAGTQPGVQIGPLIDEAAVEKVESHVADALARARRWRPAAGATPSAACSTSRPC